MQHYKKEAKSKREIYIFFSKSLSCLKYILSILPGTEDFSSIGLFPLVGVSGISSNSMVSVE